MSHFTHRIAQMAAGMRWHGNEQNMRRAVELLHPELRRLHPEMREHLVGQVLARIPRPGGPNPPNPPKAA